MVLYFINLPILILLFFYFYLWAPGWDYTTISFLSTTEQSLCNDSNDYFILIRELHFNH